MEHFHTQTNGALCSGFNEEGKYLTLGGQTNFEKLRLE